MELFINNGKKATGIELYKFIKTLNELDIGEIVLNSIDRDGTMKGYDMQVSKKVREIYDGPLTLLGGAGCVEDIKEGIDKFKIIGVAAGSLFVFKGKYKAVLINYPSLYEEYDL